MNKDKHIDPEDESTTIIEKATDGCCGGFHQTIAGALLKSPEWKAWVKEQSERMSDFPSEKSMFDVDETQMIDAMSDNHWNEFIKFIKKMK